MSYEIHGPSGDDGPPCGGLQFAARRRGTDRENAGRVRAELEFDRPRLFLEARTDKVIRSGKSEFTYEASVPFAGSLRELRDTAPELTPTEIFDAVLHVEGLLTTIGRWGLMEQRLANLEAVRSLLEAYQDEQRSERQAATLAGACEWLASRDAASQPKSRHPDAVNLLTYHGATRSAHRRSLAGAAMEKIAGFT